MKDPNSSATSSSEASPKDPLNLYSNTDYSKESEEENKSDLEFLENLEKFAESFEAKDFDSANPNISEKSKMILGAMPKKAQEYVQEIQKIKKEAEEEAKEVVDEKDPEKLRKLIEKRLENQQRVQKIAQELFIISCASNKPLEESMKFHADFKLGIKEFKDFGENGLSPLAATMVSGQAGKAEEYLNKMTQKGLSETEVINVKSPSGMTALDIAVLTGNAEMAQLLVSKGGELGLLKGPKQKQGQESAQGEDLEKLEQRSSSFNARARGNSAVRSPRNSEISEEETKKDSSEKSAQDVLRAKEIAESEIALKLSEERITKEAKKMLKAEEALQAKESKEYYEQESKFKSEQESTEKFSKEKGEVAVRTQSPNAQLAKILGISLSDSDGEISLDKLLFHAVDQNKNILAKIIVSLGGNPNHQENGVSVLSRAVERGDESLVSRLYASASSETRKLSESACGENPKMREVLTNLSRSEVSDLRFSSSTEERGSAFSSFSKDSVPKIPKSYEVSVSEMKGEASSELPPAPRPKSPIQAVSLTNSKALQVGG